MHEKSRTKKRLALKAPLKNEEALKTNNVLNSSVPTHREVLHVKPGQQSLSVSQYTCKNKE